MPDPRHGREIAGVIAPPPLIFAAFLVAGVAWGTVWPLPIFDDAVPRVTRYGVAVVLALAGIGLAAAGIVAFRRAGTDVRPDRATTALVTSGPFAVSRNPLYISQALVYLGIAVAADSGWAAALIVPTLAVIRFGVIAREEAYLERKFGDAYRSYKANVRRWL